MLICVRWTLLLIAYLRNCLRQKALMFHTNFYEIFKYFKVKIFDRASLDGHKRVLLYSRY